MEIPSGPTPFLKKVKLSGAFGIGSGEFSQPSTQEGVNKLSAGALGEKNTDDPETVLTDLTGQVTLDNGIANFVDLSFGIPGAHARMHGTYGLIDEKIDLRGQMRVDSKISNTTTAAQSASAENHGPIFQEAEKGGSVFRCGFPGPMTSRRSASISWTRTPRTRHGVSHRQRTKPSFILGAPLYFFHVCL